MEEDAKSKIEKRLINFLKGFYLPERITYEHKNFRVKGDEVLKSEEELKRVMEEYADTVRRICLVHLKSRHDTEDVFQNVYMKYLLFEGSFESREHEKAWFVRVTINACTDHLRYLSRRKYVPLESMVEASWDLNSVSMEVLEAVLRLPEKYRNVIYLYYYEGYSAVETAGILGKKENTVYTWISRGKEMLRKSLGGEWA